MPQVFGLAQLLSTAVGRWAAAGGVQATPGSSNPRRMAALSEAARQRLAGIQGIPPQAWGSGYQLAMRDMEYPRRRQSAWGGKQSGQNWNHRLSISLHGDAARNPSPKSKGPRTSGRGRQPDRPNRSPPSIPPSGSPKPTEKKWRLHRAAAACGGKGELLESPPTGFDRYGRPAGAGEHLPQRFGRSVSAPSAAAGWFTGGPAGRRSVRSSRRRASSSFALCRRRRRRRAIGRHLLRRFGDPLGRE